MLKVRVFTAFVLIFLLFYCVSYLDSSLGSLALFSVALFLVGTEFIALRWHVIDGYTHTEIPTPPLSKEFFVIGAAYACCLLIHDWGERYFGQAAGGTSLVFAWISACMVVASAAFYRRELNLQTATQKLMNLLSGFVYLAIPSIAMYKLSLLELPGSPKGLALYFSLAVILMGDTGAYFAGRAFGKTLLIPKVSPKKTLEGAYGGLAASVLTGVGFCLVFNMPFSTPLAAIIALLAGLAGQVGDLVESALKRAANCKDSGFLLPGHGGALDRVDSLVFGVPIAYLLFLFSNSVL
jgi:phosphatidate cytidylyltransferase